mgnify:CR=1 FL=1
MAPKLIGLKKEGKLPYLQVLVVIESYDYFDDPKKRPFPFERQIDGMRVMSYQELCEMGKWSEDCSSDPSLSLRYFATFTSWLNALRPPHFSIYYLLLKVKAVRMEVSQSTLLVWKSCLAQEMIVLL